MRYRVLLRQTMNGTVLDGVAAYFRRRTHKLEAWARKAEQESAKEILPILYELSSGPYTSAQLKAMGHPYRIGGVPPLDPAIINAQSGAFRAGWRVRPPRLTSDSLQTRIVNKTPYAPYLLSGTTKMIRRPILDRLRQRILPIRRQVWMKHLIEGLLAP